MEADGLHDQQVHEEKIIVNLRRDINGLAQENEFLIDDNRKLKNELDELEVRRRGKISELEKRKDASNEAIIQLETEQQMKIKAMVEEHKGRTVELNREWDNRMGHLADQVDFSKVTNNKLEQEVRRLTEELHTLRNRQETELRELETSTREREYQKYNNNLRRLEDKLIGLEQNREITNKKYYDMIRELQASEKKLNDELIGAESEADAITKENGDLKHRSAQMKIECDKFEKGLKLKGDHLRKLEDEIESLQLKGHDQKKHHSMEHKK
jgi:chromosome segregation ATPase